MIGKVMTWGYSKKRTVSDLLEAVVAAGGEIRKTWVVDCRLTRGSMNHCWRGDAARRLMGAAKYVRPASGNDVGTLGNMSGTAEWKPPGRVNAKLEIDKLRAFLRAGMTVVLICAEADHEKCHRVEVARQVALHDRVEVVNL